MLLSDGGIAAALDSGELAISLYDEARLQPSSYDVTLGDSFAAYPSEVRVIDPRRPPKVRPLFPDGANGLYLLPGMFMLATTAEHIGLGPGVAARVEGKSTLGRCGLAIHTTAGFIDPGFCGQVTLELSNVGPAAIRLTPGMPIGQLCLFRLDAKARRPYGTDGLGSHYQGQSGASGPRAD